MQLSRKKFIEKVDWSEECGDGQADRKLATREGTSRYIPVLWVHWYKWRHWQVWLRAPGLSAGAGTLCW